MKDDDRRFDDNEWTPEERARVAALSVTRVPPAGLKQRTMRALRDGGHIGRRGVSPWVVVGGLLAATIVFAAGALVGYAAANRRPAPSGPATVTATRAVAQIDSTKAEPMRHVVWY